MCSVLESLEQEYKREEDWCGGADKLGPNSETDHVTPMISKHLEQKEAFLKVGFAFFFFFSVFYVLESMQLNAHSYCAERYVESNSAHSKATGTSQTAKMWEMAR